MSKNTHTEKKVRLDLWLVENNYVPSRAKAQELIKAQQIEILTNGKWQKIDRANELVPTGQEFPHVRLISENLLRYVSRGGLKLEGALRHLKLNVSGWTILDVGQSTGGFTDCLLQSGCRQVIGIDVGRGQLHQKLQGDSRVVAHENFHVKDLRGFEGERLRQSLCEKIDLVVVDVSFISLRQVLPHLHYWLSESEPYVLALVKPQFELGAKALNKKGVVKDSGQYEMVRVMMQKWSDENHWQILQYFPSELIGGEGNREFFIFLERKKMIKNVLELFLPLLFFALTILPLGCASLKTKEQENISRSSSPSASSQDVKSSKGSVSDSQPSSGSGLLPNSSSRSSMMSGQGAPKVGVILGPGGVKAFAHAGVLKELVKARIPIEGVVGIEWGALVGGLYAQQGQIRELEWKLYKLQKSELPGRGLFSSRFKAEPIKVLNDYLKKNLKGHALEKSRLNFACPTLSLWSGTLIWQDRGDMMAAIEHCLPYPPFFRPHSPWMAGAFSVEDSIRYLKKKGFGVIIYVNVLGTGELFSQEEMLEDYQTNIIWQELRRSQHEARSLATDVIEVDTKDFKMYDFDGRNGLVSAGEQAGSQAAKQIAEKYGF